MLLNSHKVVTLLVFALVAISPMSASANSLSSSMTDDQNIQMLLSLGTWKTLTPTGESKTGQVRLLATTQAQDTNDLRYQIVWTTLTEDATRVEARSDIKEWGGQFITKAAQLNLISGRGSQALLITTYDRKKGEYTEWVLKSETPGNYRLFKDESSVSTNEKPQGKEHLLIYYARPTF